MDPMYFIKTYAPRGSIIFINYGLSMTSHFNPSIDKHAAIYYGVFFTEHLVVESTFNKVVRLRKLEDLLKGYISVKVYILKDIDIMYAAADNSITLLGIPYGFGNNKMYCFKLVATCYKLSGFFINSKMLLGKDIFISQCFTEDSRWIKIYDSNEVLLR
ncbi:NlpC/P60 superfamily protein [Yokapox virus]|uniref:Protein OPG091 n=1 Tax=Yokapox virus TaxID=1076255 RepID=G3EIE1_9POXV|nr:NlpC/P60 superfamily protein [Yokapox virus]AEN03652.1 NlpC/P60 superfamily protein [Yokapox virus]